MGMFEKGVDFSEQETTIEFVGTIGRIGMSGVFS